MPKSLCSIPEQVWINLLTCRVARQDKRSRFEIYCMVCCETIQVLGGVRLYFHITRAKRHSSLQGFKGCPANVAQPMTPSRQASSGGDSALLGQAIPPHHAVQHIIDISFLADSLRMIF